MQVPREGGAFRGYGLASTQLGAAALGEVFSCVWLSFVAYTWLGIPVYRRMLAREVASVRLRPGF